MTPIAKMGMLSSALLWLVTGCASDAPVYVKPAQPARGADVIEPRSLDAAAAAPRTDPQLDQRMSQMEQHPCVTLHTPAHITDQDQRARLHRAGSCWVCNQLACIA